jgi:hypothetical protein
MIPTGSTPAHLVEARHSQLLPGHRGMRCCLLGWFLVSTGCQCVLLRTVSSMAVF